MRHVIAMGLVAALLGSCVEAESDLPTVSEDTAELGGTNTVFAVQASAASWWALTIREDKVTSPVPNWKSVSTAFTLGMKAPGPPQLDMKFRVTAPDEDTACAVGILIGLAVASGQQVPDAVQGLLNANIVAQVDQVVIYSAVPPGPPNINLGEVAHLGDMALHADRPGGGCIIFDQGLIALGLPDGCTEDPTPTPQLPIAGSFFALASIGPGRSLTITETQLAPDASGNARFSVKYVVGVREAAIKPKTVTVVASAQDPLIASMATLAAGAGLLADYGPRAIFEGYLAAGTPINLETITFTNPPGSAIPPEDIASMVDAAVAAVGPGGGCIVFGQAASAFGFQMGCATGEH